MTAVTLEKAKELYEAKDFKNAFAAFCTLGNDGNAESQFFIGKMYDRGDGVSADLFRARSWYESAAKQAHTSSQFNLAGFYLTGEGGAKLSYDAAYFWYREAYKLGDEECLDKMKAINETLVDPDSGDPVIRVDDYIFEDLPGAVVQATADLTETEEIGLLSWLELNWSKELGQANATARKEGSADVSLSYLSEVIEVAFAYAFLADIYEFLYRKGKSPRIS
jgi:TPR repeat protein